MKYQTELVLSGLGVILKNTEWVSEYHQSRPGLKELQRRIDEFIVAHEAKLDQVFRGFLYIVLICAILFAS